MEFNTVDDGQYCQGISSVLSKDTMQYCGGYSVLWTMKDVQSCRGILSVVHLGDIIITAKDVQYCGRFKTKVEDIIQYCGMIFSTVEINHEH